MRQRSVNSPGLRGITYVALCAGCSRTELSTAEHFIKYRDETPVTTLVVPTVMPPVTTGVPTVMPPTPPTAVPPMTMTPPPTAVPTTVPTTPPTAEPECPAILFESCVFGSFCSDGTLISCSVDEFGCPSEIEEPNAPQCAGGGDECPDDADCGDAGAGCGPDGCSEATCSADFDLGYQVGLGVGSGSTIGATSDIYSACALGSRSPDLLYRWTAPSAGCYQIDTFGANYDTALALRSACDQFEEILCNDDAGDGSGVAFQATAEVEYYIVVDGFATGSAGEYVLNIRDCGEACDGAGFDEDDDGAVDCDDPECQLAPPCLEEVCGNSADDDGDGLVDCSDGDCFGHSTCFEYCEDGVDNDVDGDTDCDDSTCVSDSACRCPAECCLDGALQDIDACEGCSCLPPPPSPPCDADAGPCECPDVDVEAESTIDAVLASGSTTGAGDDVPASCGFDSAEDVVVRWIAPSSGCVRFSTRGSDFDSVLHVHTCDGEFTELGCDDDLGGLGAAEIDVSVSEGTAYYIVVDGYDPTTSGYYELNAWICP